MGKGWGFFFFFLVIGVSLLSPVCCFSAKEEIGRLSVCLGLCLLNMQMQHSTTSPAVISPALICYFFFFFHAPQPLTVNTIGLFRESGGKYIKKYKEPTDVFRVKKPLLIITLRPSQRRRCGQRKKEMLQNVFFIFFPKDDFMSLCGRDRK